MDAQKNNSKSRFNVQFNCSKPKQEFAVQCLHDKGRKKSAYIAEAIWFYEKTRRNKQANNGIISIDEDLLEIDEPKLTETMNRYVHEPDNHSEDDVVELETHQEFIPEKRDMQVHEEGTNHSDIPSNEAVDLDIDSTERQESKLHNSAIMDNLKALGLSY